jgi:hypothetical protein
MRQIDSQSVAAVFGAGRVEPEAYRQAEATGRVLGLQGYGVVNGGYGGVMEASARGAVAAGSVAVGVTCRPFRREANAYVSQVVETTSLQQRVTTLLELATAGFVVLPGGTGTLLELATVWELLNKGLLTPRPLVCVGDFWRPVVEQISAVAPQSARQVQFVSEPGELEKFFPAREQAVGS